jgi:hypothetical protein
MVNAIVPESDCWRDKSRGYDGLFAFEAWRILEGVAQAR